MEKLMPRENADVGHGNSDDMDFNDVFGGPPKKFSLQEVRSRYSFGETEEEAWGGLKEKPVFGDEIRSRRRHNGGGDFFDDIFKVGDSSTSPRWSDRSNPGSRIMSPAWPLPSNSDPSASSLPPHFSLPAKLSKTTELPTFGSGSTTNGVNSPHSSSPLSRFSNPAIRSQDERTNIEVQPLPRKILFCNEPSFITEDPPSTLVSDQKDATHNLKKDAKSTADNIGNMFHFSIYKWAGKGIPMLTVPLVAANSIQSKVKNDRSSVVRKQSSPENLRSKEETKELPKAVYEFSKMESQTQSTPNYNAVSSESDVGEKIKKQETESLNSELDKQTKTAEGVHADVHGSKKVKGNEGIGIDSNKEKPEKSSIKGVTKSASKGKVKEFVHIFNQEPDPMLKPEFEKIRSCRWRNVGSDQNEASSNAKTAKEQVNSHDFVRKPDVSSKVDENLNKNEEQRDSNINPQKTFSSESIHTDSRVPAENADDDPVEDNFLVQELTDDNENVKESESCEETKAIDVKIRQWSVGKKGNIRSLLSTLQYVLWAESGWKPVPLMDLIEANSVKRAYQKALLRLHPDKLQQKGASFQHKYIAEKVFDILQEAWDHFNTSSVTM